MNSSTKPELFVDLTSVDASISIDLKYFSGDNFVAEQIRGYEHEVCFLTLPAAKAVARVQAALKNFGLGLKVFDAYRPQRAVDHFIEWTENTEKPATHTRFFPGLTAPELFSKGYLIRHSSHSRGSTVDLTIIDLASGEELDMGTEFDYFGPESWFDDKSVTTQARANRMLLQMLMVQHGFVPFHQEWWHFTLADEPYPYQYFDFPII